MTLEAFIPKVHLRAPYLEPDRSSFYRAAVLLEETRPRKQGKVFKRAWLKATEVLHACANRASREVSREHLFLAVNFFACFETRGRQYRTSDGMWVSIPLQFLQTRAEVLRLLEFVTTGVVATTSDAFIVQKAPDPRETLPGFSELVSYFEVLFPGRIEVPQTHAGAVLDFLALYGLSVCETVETPPENDPF